MTEEELISLKFTSPEDAKAKGYNDEMMLIDRQTHQKTAYKLRCFYKPADENTPLEFIKKYTHESKNMEVWYQYVNW